MLALNQLTVDSTLDLNAKVGHTYRVGGRLCMRVQPFRSCLFRAWHWGHCRRVCRVTFRQPAHVYAILQPHPSSSAVASIAPAYFLNVPCLPACLPAVQLKLPKWDETCPPGGIPAVLPRDTVE